MEIKPSESQQKICDKEGSFCIKACPGSGKTLTVTHKLVNLLKNNSYKHQGIAILSFTNVAWEEIQLKLDKYFNIPTPLKYPHFLGTIDKFLNQYIFYKYYYLLDEFNEDKCNGRPELVGYYLNPWTKNKSKYDYDKYFDVVSYDLNKDLIYKSSTKKFFFGKLKKADGHYSNIQKIKEKYINKGFVTQADINYFSYCILKNNDYIAKLIASRFPILFVDEAQDTSEIQMAILDILSKYMEQMILIGDPNQSIFEWNNASPQIFKDKINDNYLFLNENWRSSQKICDFSYKLSDLDSPSKAVNNEVKKFDFIPQIWSYTDENDLNGYIDDFLSLCHENDIVCSQDNMAILVRSKKLQRKLLGINYDNIAKFNENVFLKDLIHSKYYYDNFDFKKAYKLIEKLYFITYKSKLSNNEYIEFINQIDFFNLRSNVHEIFKIMPNIKDIILNDWVNIFRKNLKKSKIDKILKNFLLEKLVIDSSISDIKIKELILDNYNRDLSYSINTIHQVKGQTFDAVLLILKRKGGIGKYYSTYIKEDDDFTEIEELRNVYVAITRPRKILVLVVPKDDFDVWNDFFFKENEKQPTLFDF